MAAKKKAKVDPLIAINKGIREARTDMREAKRTLNEMMFEVTKGERALDAGAMKAQVSAFAKAKKQLDKLTAKL